MSRLHGLLDELEVEAEAVADPGRTVAPRDPFFTAGVLASLPGRLAFTGITPRQRVMVLGAFYLLAIAVAGTTAWAFGSSFGGLTAHVHGWSDALGDLSWSWIAMAVCLVAAVAFVATRSATTSVQEHG